MAKIYEASFSDYNDVMSLSTQYGLPYKSHEEWLHLWNNNPALLEYDRPWPIGWTLKDDKNKVVGFLGNIPLLYEFRGRKLIAAAAHTWVVDKPFRKYSKSLVKRYFEQNGADMLLNTTGGHRSSVRIFTEFGAIRVPAVSYDISSFLILNYQRVVSGFLANKCLQRYNFISYPVSYVMRVIDGLKKIRAGTKAMFDANVKRYETFDSRFDMFWDELRGRNKKLLCTRNSRALNWHFKYLILRQRLWIFTVERECKIIGYSVFIKDNKDDIGLRRATLVDLQTLDDDHKTILPMIYQAIKQCRLEGIHMLESIGFNSEKRKIVEKLLTHKRKLTVWPLYKTKSKDLEEELYNTDSWDPCLFDGDGSF